MKSRVIAVVSLALGACSNDASPGPDAMPTAVRAQIDPGAGPYRYGDTVRLTGLVTNADGVALGDIAVAWTSSRDAIVGTPTSTPSTTAFHLSAVGSVTFTGCVLPDGEILAEELCSELSIDVAAPPPVLIVDTPQPGDAAGPAPIDVAGHVMDPAIRVVHVNGLPTDVDEAGSFSTTLAGTFGTNHITVATTNDASATPDVELDVLWAPAYGPSFTPGAPPALTLTGGIAARLDKRLLDDGAPLDTDASPIKTRDLADLVALTLPLIDLSASLANPVVDEQPTFVLRATNPSLSAAIVAIEVVDDGLSLSVVSDPVTATTAGTLIVDGQSLPLDGQVTGRTRHTGKVTVEKISQDATLAVSITDVTSELVSIEGRFDNDETAALFQLEGMRLRTTLETVLLDAVASAIEETVPALLGEALGAVDRTLDDTSLKLNSNIFPSTTLNLDARIASLEINADGSLSALLTTQINSEALDIQPNGAGLARIEETATPAEFASDSALQIGLRLAVLNGLLHVLWRAGHIELNAVPHLPEALQPSVATARLSGKLPPILRPPTDTESHDLVISLGQLELELATAEETVRFAAQIAAGVSVQLSGGRLALVIDATPTIDLWTIAPSYNAETLNEAMVADLLTDLWLDLRASLASGLAFDLPLPVPGNLGGLAAGLRAFTSNITLTGLSWSGPGHLILDVGVTGELPR